VQGLSAQGTALEEETLHRFLYKPDITGPKEKMGKEILITQ